MEPISKKVIYSKNPHQKLCPASMTKMMGLYLILEAVENKKISFDDEVVISSYAISFSQCKTTSFFVSSLYHTNPYFFINFQFIF